MTRKINPVILCGGSGVRLWPLSRRDVPKQFAVRRNGKSLFELAFDRVYRHPGVEQVTCVTHEDYRFLVKALTGEGGEQNVLLLEPVARNTAPAIASAALLAARNDPKAILAVLPSDHAIEDEEVFLRALSFAAESAEEGRLTILGVTPTSPSSSFGYILPGARVAGSAGARLVTRFVEKPDAETAREYCRNGYLWNSGMVVARADVLLDAFSRLAPELLGYCRAALAGATREYGHIRLAPEPYQTCPSISFDYAVLERLTDLAVVELSAGWNDLGTWTELETLYDRDERGNRLSGDVVLESSSNTFVMSPHRLAVALGLEDVVIVDTPDALMVASRSELPRLRDVVGKLSSAGRTETSAHRSVARPWGSFVSVDAGDNHQVKRITVRPGASLSLQYHRHRSEHWIVVKGSAQVTCGERRFTLNRNESTYIAQGEVHRLENVSDEPLELIEVQSGSYLGEDDIVRIDDTYGRVGEDTAESIRHKRSAKS